MLKSYRRGLGFWGFFWVLRLSYTVKLNFNLVLILAVLGSCIRYFRNKMY